MFNWLFVDLNSYFASVEQQEQPRLRKKPTAVVPLMAETTSCIAASYEAKRFGVKTGTRVAEARKMCPGIEFVVARHDIYIEYHEAIVAAVESCLPVTSVLSIDEMACRLTGSDREPEKALALAQTVKKRILNVGSELTSSVGLAPNRFLSKVASDMQKPDGLTTIIREELPNRLFVLELRDLPGIGPRMETRLNERGVTTVEQLCARDMESMRFLWGSVNGERLYRWLRGEDFLVDFDKHQSIGHSHVLPPELRHREGAHMIGMKLLNKATVRLRKLNLWASRLNLSISYDNGLYWDEKIKTIECQDTLTLMEAFESLWASSPQHHPFKVSITLSHLVPEHEHNLSFFEQPKRRHLSQAMDLINKKYGRETIYFAGLHHAKSAAPTRIAFQSIPDLEV